uniref:Uncharacterized protein n=1 Tax=Trichuris muris TaxID=70415 RepID=A0A5S6QBY5_TRIMR
MQSTAQALCNQMLPVYYAVHSHYIWHSLIQSGRSHLPDSRLPDWSFARQSIARQSFARQVICPTGHLPDRSFARLVVCPTGRLPDWSFARLVVCPTGRLPDWSFARLVVCPTGHLPDSRLPDSLLSDRSIPSIIRFSVLGSSPKYSSFSTGPFPRLFGSPLWSVLSSSRSSRQVRLLELSIFFGWAAVGNGRILCTCEAYCLQYSFYGPLVE